MNRLNLSGLWPILVFVILFLVLPLATLPGFFNAIFVVLMGIAVIITVLIIAALVTNRRQSKV